MSNYLNDNDELEVLEDDDLQVDELDSDYFTDDTDGEDDDHCDLDPSKICDNCFRCLDSNLPDYEEIKIGEIIIDMDEHAFDFANTPFKYDK